MILENTYQMYQAFLDGIKKYGTGAVDPNAFNRIINDWGQHQWIKENIRHGIELTQDLIDRLSVLRVVTDGEYMFSRNIDLDSKYVLHPIVPNSEVIWFQYLTKNGLTNALPNSDKYFKYPLSHSLELTGGTKVWYPPYLRLLNVSFKIEYIENECKKTGVSEWLDAKIMRSDNKTVIWKNVFRKPNDSRLYYEIINEHIVLSTGTKSKGHSMKLEYLRYPNNIYFNTNNGGNLELEQTGIPDYTGTTQGSVNCELPNYLRQEVVDMAVRTFVERVKDPRYQSYINELNIKNNG